MLVLQDPCTVVGNENSSGLLNERAIGGEGERRGRGEEGKGRGGEGERRGEEGRRRGTHIHTSAHMQGTLAHDNAHTYILTSRVLNVASDCPSVVSVVANVGALTVTMATECAKCERYPTPG